MSVKNESIVKKITKAYQTIGVMGIAKNTGKTTTLNAIIEDNLDQTIGLTSIGLDGESLDQVNFLPKPKIKVYPKMIVATAKTCLETTTASYEVLSQTGYFTSIGEIWIVRVIQEGYMIIAGSTTNHELSQIIKIMKQYASFILVDGAFNRMTFANIHHMDAVVLASGASFHPNMEETILQTRFITEVFGSKKTNTHFDMSYAITFETHQKVYTMQDKKSDTIHHWFNQHQETLKTIAIKGALTPKIMDLLISHQIENVTIVLEDPTKCLLKHTYRPYLINRKIVLEVLKPCKIIMVTINPWSPIGQHYDASLFHQRMKDALNVPVINVMQEEEKSCQNLT